MSRREFARLAAAAGVACGLGPLLALLGGITALGLVGTVPVGASARLVAAVGITLVLLRRRRSRRAGACHPERVVATVGRLGAHR